jgi:hypothetical protein
MSDTFTRTRGRASFELSMLGRLYRDAYDPEVEIRRFEDALLTMARTRQLELHGGTSPRLRFALDQLLPLRTMSARRHLRRDRLAADAFASFLRFSAESAMEVVADATSIEEIADAILSELDGFHAYLVGNELVDSGYVTVEHAIADHLLRRSPVPHEGAARDPEPELELASASADVQDLALAA